MRKTCGSIVRALIAAGAVLLAAGAIAQGMTQEDLAAATAVRTALRDGRYMAADDAARRVAFDAAGKPRPGFGYDQWAELQGLLTGEPARRIWSDGVVPKPASETDLKVLATASTQDAIAAIVERAKKTRLVILNEDHASPRDRAFGLQVARALRPLGYDVLGAETLSNIADDTAAAAAMAALARDGYPRRKTGYYVRDPVFADFLRQSLALGYRPVAYETTDYTQAGSMDEQIARREQMQADYIVARALKAYPNSRVLLYVGFSHATENPTRSGARWLATRLKAMTGLDPLTIDQTILNEYGAGDTALYAAIAPRVGARPVALFANGKPLVVGQYAGQVDLQVAHPRTVRIGGRPDWLRAMGRRLVPIPPNLLPTTGRRLIQAFIVGETDGMPIDQVLVTPGRPVRMLLLPPGVAIRYAVQDPAP